MHAVHQQTAGGGQHTAHGFTEAPLILYHASRITHHTTPHISTHHSLEGIGGGAEQAPLVPDQVRRGGVGRVCIFILTNDATTSETNNVMIAVSL